MAIIISMCTNSNSVRTYTHTHKHPLFVTFTYVKWGYTRARGGERERGAARARRRRRRPACGGDDRRGRHVGVERGQPRVHALRVDPCPRASQRRWPLARTLCADDVNVGVGSRMRCESVSEVIRFKRTSGYILRWRGCRTKRAYINAKDALKSAVRGLHTQRWRGLGAAGAADGGDEVDGDARGPRGHGCARVRQRRQRRHASRHARTRTCC